MNKKITLFIDKNNNRHVDSINAFQNGFKKFGINSIIRDIYSGYIESDLIVIFGVSKKSTFQGQARGRIIESHNDLSSTIVIERGFVKRDIYNSIGIGGLNGRADFKNESSPSDRWEKLQLNLKPHQHNDDGFILLSGQVPWDASVQHINYYHWVTNIFNTLIKTYGKEKVLFSHHPFSLNKAYKPVNLPFFKSIKDKKIEDILPLCKYTIAFNSNVGVDSILAGVPTVSIDEGSMVYHISGHDIFKPIFPSQETRLQWAYNIAYSQWTNKEIMEGLPHKHLELI